jgi:Zn-dependent peptidase ImmA (M78 family)
LIQRRREFEIRSKALEVLDYCGIDYKRPISTKIIVEKYKIYHAYQNIKGLNGYSIYDKKHDRYLMITDNTLHFNRHKFTIGHELGHIFLDHLKRNMKYGTEREAYIFTDELLMPTLGILHLGLNTAEEIAEHYQVSLDAAKIKIDTLENTIYHDYIDRMDSPVLKNSFCW